MSKEKTWVISLSNGEKFYITENLKNKFSEMAEQSYRWVISDDFLIKIEHIVAIYKLEENK